jgi:hypothetical protein
MSNGAAVAVASVDVLRPPITRSLPNVARRGAPRHEALVPSGVVVGASAAASTEASAEASAAASRPASDPPELLAPEPPPPELLALPELLAPPDASTGPDPLDDPPGAGPASASPPSPVDDADPHAGTAMIPTERATSARRQAETGFLIRDLSAWKDGW